MAGLSLPEVHSRLEKTSEKPDIFATLPMPFHLWASPNGTVLTWALSLHLLEHELPYLKVSQSQPKRLLLFLTPKQLLLNINCVRATDPQKP